jgi:hypothetical protein
MNLKDMAFKLFWTVANAALAFATVQISGVEPAPAWGAFALLVIQLVSTYVRQQLGATPADAPAVGPIGNLTS